MLETPGSAITYRLITTMDVPAKIFHTMESTFHFQAMNMAAASMGKDVVNRVAIATLWVDATTSQQPSVFGFSVQYCVTVKPFEQDRQSAVMAWQQAVASPSEEFEVVLLPFDAGAGALVVAPLAATNATVFATGFATKIKPLRGVSPNSFAVPLIYTRSPCARTACGLLMSVPPGTLLLGLDTVLPSNVQKSWSCPILCDEDEEGDEAEEDMRRRATKQTLSTALTKKLGSSIVASTTSTTWFAAFPRAASTVRGQPLLVPFVPENNKVPFR